MTLATTEVGVRACGCWCLDVLLVGCLCGVSCGKDGSFLFESAGNKAGIRAQLASRVTRPVLKTMTNLCF